MTVIVADQTSKEARDARDRERLTVLVTQQLRAQRVEEQLETWLRRGLLGRTSPAGGARVAIVAAACAMGADDLVFGTARDLPAAFPRGMSVETALRQALGRDGDPALGRGLPGAVRHRRSGVTLSDSSPAAHLVHAAGFGHAAQLKNTDRVALGLFGSGAQGNGEVHAAFNFAALMKSRVIFVARGPLAGELPLVEAAPAWGIHAVAVDGADGLAVWEAVEQARVRAVAGDGPTVVDARWRHADEQGSRDVRRLTELGGWSEQRDGIIAGLDAELAAAVGAARDAPRVPEHTLTEHLLDEADV